MSLSTTTTLIASTIATVSDVSAKPLPSRTVSEEVVSEVRGGLHTLYEMVKHMGEALPAFEKCGEKELERIAYRALSVMKAEAKYQQDVARQAKEAKRLAYRAKLQSVFAPHMETARQEKTAYDGLPASLKSKLGAFPTEVKVPVSEMMSIFGEGLTTEQVVDNLGSLDLKVGRGKEKNAPYYVILPFTTG